MHAAYLVQHIEDGEDARPEVNFPEIAMHNLCERRRVSNPCTISARGGGDQIHAQVPLLMRSYGRRWPYRIATAVAARHVYQWPINTCAFTWQSICAG